MNKIYYLLLFIPLSLLMHFVFHANSAMQFAAFAISIIPLAALIGESTEGLAVYCGPRIGGFLSATFGNATELIISIFALKAGLLDVVKASIAGSIIGNVLLVLGFSMLLGGFKYKEQKFSPKNITVHSNTMTFAVLGLLIPAIFTHSLSYSANAGNLPKYEWLSVFVAVILFALYISGFVFSFITHKDVLGTDLVIDEEIQEHGWSKNKCILGLLTATVLVALQSEFLVENIEPMVEQFHINRTFVGLIVIPILGNVAEHSTSVIMAMKNKMDVAIEIAVGSSSQMTLCVAPILVFLSLFFTPMSLVFNLYELAAIYIAVVIMNKVCADGESNWLEGLQLIGIYCILGAAFCAV